MPEREDTTYRTVLPFGQYKGKRFADVPLKYLDWLVDQEWLFADLRVKLEAYLNDPLIQQELAKELDVHQREPVRRNRSRHFDDDGCRSSGSRREAAERKRYRKSSRGV